ncbi:MAG: Uma2 family endonuclease [Thiomargarita sp.]|nr:Uma2 family endonuclease [Thiomargarita sp.]
MSELYEIENNAIDGEDEMGSLNHSTVQTNLAGLLKFKCDKKLAVMTELSLDISQHDISQYDLDASAELKPDVCAYLKRPVIPEGKNDLIKVSQMPDLVIEILSPRQSVDYLVRKTNAYFELGVRTGWLVNPDQKIITVYSRPERNLRGKTFALDTTPEVIDDIIDIRFLMREIFEEEE